MKIVSNAGPILSFARAGRLDLLRQVVGELIIPDAVVQDIVVRGKGKPGAEEVQQGAWIKRGSVKDRSVLEQLSGKLNLGEREALAAKEIGAALLVGSSLRLRAGFFASKKNFRVPPILNQ